VVASVESVTIAESGLTIALAPGATLTTSLMVGKHGGGGGRGTGARHRARRGSLNWRRTRTVVGRRIHHTA